MIHLGVCQMRLHLLLGCLLCCYLHGYGLRVKITPHRSFCQSPTCLHRRASTGITFRALSQQLQGLLSRVERDIFCRHILL